jgi:uncharacterized protein YbjT (DUF2867 family)
MRILLTGATGLVGQGVLRECLRATDVTHVGALGRHPTDVVDARLEHLSCPDFAELDAVRERLAPFDVCFYCAGAPLVGISAAAYGHVTLDLTRHVAEAFAQRNPGAKFIYISGAHADLHSRVAVLRIKGETEQALAALPLTTVMVRPGGIQPVDGVRSTHRPLDLFYRFGAPVMGLAVKFLPSQMTTTARVGRAMLALAREEAPAAVVENDAINRLGQ